MSSNDLRLLKGIITELSRYLEQHIQEDEEFFVQLQQFPFYKKIKIIPTYFRKIHKTAKADLEKAHALCEKGEQEILTNISEARRINEIIPRINSFYGELNKEHQFLMSLLGDLEKEGNINLLVLIKQRIISSEKMFQNERFKQIKYLQLKIHAKVRPLFKIKGGLISFNRPKIKEVVQIGDALVYLEIYFDKDLSDKIISNLFQSYTTILLDEVNKELHKKVSPYSTRIKFNIIKNANFLKENNLRTIEQFLLLQLRDMIVTLLEKNKDLILTPRFRYQITITKDYGSLVACDANSLADQYLFLLEISSLIVSYLISENVYDEVTDSVFYYSFSLASKIPVHSLRYHTWSLYSTFAHETQHAFAQNMNQRRLKLLPLLQSLIWESEFYKNHKTLNLAGQLFGLIEFYFRCRIESPPPIQRIHCSS
ncbi:hypothetical protein J4444_03220 [Candidatus Woesearchaeota archaeon]|nr:hypothetical protein [Candidatus Woesearchaeota archaeon]